VKKRIWRSSAAPSGGGAERPLAEAAIVTKVGLARDAAAREPVTAIKQLRQPNQVGNRIWLEEDAQLN